MKILIAAAGTGGHVVPALTVALYAKQKGILVHWLATNSGMENSIVSPHSIPIHHISFSGVRKKGVKRWLTLPFSLLKACAESLKILQKEQPHAILVMGGYISVPVALVGWVKNIPVFIHEQNSIPGLANQFCSRLATKVCYGFPNTFSGNNPKYIHTGNPIRSELLKFINHPNDYKKINQHKKLNVLIIGGSLGAQKLNKILPQALAMLQKKLNVTLSVYHQSGKNNLTSTQANYQQLALSVKIVEFSEDLYQQYSIADLIVARSGAMTVSEISVINRPTLFVPYPYAVNDHQYNNAMQLVNNKTVGNRFAIIRDSQLTAENCAQKLHQLYHHGKSPLLPDCDKPISSEANSELKTHTQATQNILQIIQQHTPTS